VETGKYHITDYLAVADVGTVIHPKALGGQITGRSVLGIGHAIGQKWVFDPQYGHFVSRRFYHTKPPTILDVPGKHAVGGARHARSGDASWSPWHWRTPSRRRVWRYSQCPVRRAWAMRFTGERQSNLDTILTALEAGRPTQDPLTAHV
jgi:hypothetical protein